MDNIKRAHKIDMENTDRKLKIVKVRNVVAKIVDDRGHPTILDDREVVNMIEDFMSADFVDKEGNKHQLNGISNGDTIIRKNDIHFEKFKEVMKNISQEKLLELKEHIHGAIRKDPLFGTSIDSIGIDLDNFENYLGSV